MSLSPLAPRLPGAGRDQNLAMRIGCPANTRTRSKNQTNCPQGAQLFSAACAKLALQRTELSNLSTQERALIKRSPCKLAGDFRRETSGCSSRTGRPGQGIRDVAREQHAPQEELPGEELMR